MTPPRPPTLRPGPGSGAASSKPPAVSGAGSHVDRGVPIAPTPSLQRVRLPTQHGMGEDAAEVGADRDAEGADTVSEPGAAAGARAPASSPKIGLSPTGKAAPSRPAVPQLATSVREEVWTIVRAAVESAVAPLAEANKQLQSRLDQLERAVERERLERERLVTAAGAAVSAAQASAAAAHAIPSIPVAFDAALASAIAPAIPTPARLPVAPASEPGSAEAPPRRFAQAPSRIPGGSIPPTGFGVVVSEGPRPSLVVAGPPLTEIETPDFGKRRRMVGRLVVVGMLLGVVGALVASILSHT
jgi:hypothetical protein